MKKTLLKIGFIVLCVGTAIFLLLPFLETTAPVNSSLKAGQAQVVTENPLNVISKRLAALFGRKERTQKTLPEQNTATNNLLIAQNYPSYAPNGQQPAAAGQATSGGSSQTVAVPPSNQPFDYENASFQMDNGEWVLVQQTAPQHSAPGMHEVNVHENPYDRYIRQEQARSFGPQTPKQEIPDSKWARLVSPLKTFLGLDATSAQSSPASVRVNRGDEKGLSLGTGNDKLNGSGTNKFSDFPRMRLSSPDISPQAWAMLTPQEREAYKERKAARDFADLLSGDRAAREAAEIIANIKFPNPQDAKEKQEKEEFTQQLTEEAKLRIKEGMLANLRENTAGKQSVDELAYMTGCKDASLPPTQCEDFSPNQHVPNKVLEKASAENAELFLKETQFILPEGLPFTVVLGPTDTVNFNDGRPLNPNTAEIYNFLGEQLQCASRTCYWLPNSNQPDPKLGDAIATIGGAKLKTDPFNIYDTNEAAFVEYKVRKELGPDATSEQIAEVQRKAREQWQNERPNWVPGWGEHLRQLQADTTEALSAPLNQPSTKSPIFIMVKDPGVAPDVAQLIGPGFVYSKNPLIDSDSPIQTGEDLTKAMAENFNDAKEVIHKSVEPLYEEAVKMNLGASYNQAARANNQNGSGFAGLLESVKRWMNHSSK